MSKSLDRFRREWLRIWNVLGRINWSDETFTPEKAYICSVFSKLAYLHVPEFEVLGESQVKVIPCLTHQEIAARGLGISTTEFIRRLDIPDAFIIETEYAIVVGAVVQNVLILAFRGTRLLYLSDWFIDLHAAPFRPPIGSDHVFHKGFYLALTQCLDRVTLDVKQRLNGKNIPVYVTGHSLGGALAAVIHALRNKKFLARYQFEGVNETVLETHSCYTFGMPRYGSTATMLDLPVPHHLYNARDIVPLLPPKFIGFADTPREYVVGNTGTLESISVRPSLSISSALGRLHLARGIRHHFIERYIKNIYAHLKHYRQV